MASNIASGVGFIGAGAIHKSKLHGHGSESQNVVAGLTTAAAIWVSAAVGVASAVGLYFVGAVATFGTVAILKYARLPHEEGLNEEAFSWEPRPLEVVEEAAHGAPPQSRHRLQESSHPTKEVTTSGFFGTEDHKRIIDRATKDSPPIRIKEVISDPRFEQAILRQIAKVAKDGDVVDQREVQREKPKVLIEEEQQVVSYNVTDDEQEIKP